MALERNQQALGKQDIWIISSGRNTKFDLSIDSEEVQTIFAKEYKISDLARYLLSPDPIEVKKMLIGCEIHFHQTFADKLRKGLKNVVPERFHGRLKEKNIVQETLMANCEQGSLFLKDKGLESHVQKIRSVLDDYDPVLKRLSMLDEDEISNVIGICEDIGGNRSLLNLKGGVDEKINYMKAFLLKNVGVILEKAYIADGLFEMSGFDFTGFNTRNSHRLIKFHADGSPRSCVIDSKGEVEFWVNDTNLISNMHLLEQSIKANPVFNEVLSSCTNGNAKPLRLLFKRKLEIDYTKSPLPSLYKDLFDAYNIGSNEKATIIKSLKNSQLGILFNYVPNLLTGKKRPFTNISVMHDVRALDTIKDNLPNLYSAINKRVSVSEAGRYYLLDYLKGNGNE